MVLILVVVVNIGFLVFLILVYNLVKDKFLLYVYMDCGDCLGYFNGIILLVVGVIVLIFIFYGKMMFLILFYVVGVFVLFILL